MIFRWMREDFWHEARKVERGVLNSVRKRNLTPHRVKKTAQAWKIISFAGIRAVMNVQVSK